MKIRFARHRWFWMLLAGLLAGCSSGAVPDVLTVAPAGSSASPMTVAALPSAMTAATAATVGATGVPAPTATTLATGTLTATGATASAPMPAVVAGTTTMLGAATGGSPGSGAGAAATASIPVPTGMAQAPASDMDKIDDVFLRLLDIYQKQGQDAALQFARDQQLLTPQNEIRVTLALDTDDPAAVESTAVNVARIGGRVTQSSGDEMEIVVPVQTLMQYAQMMSTSTFFNDLATFRHVRNIRRTPLALHSQTMAPPRPTGTSAAGGGRTGRTDEGVAFLGADKWQAAGITGKGVRVGIIDTSFNRYRDILGNTRYKIVSLRSDNAVEDRDLNRETIHGTAVAEIVHKIAPDAELVLVAVDTSLSFVKAVDYLTASEGAVVISSSLGFFAFEADGTSKLSKAVDAARAAGITVTISAGNDASGAIGSDYGEGHFSATFVDSDRDGFHDFPGLTTKNGLVIQSGGASAQIVLTWTDPHVNLDLYLYDERGNLVDRSTDVQSPRANRSAFEGIVGTLRPGNYVVKVKKVNPADPNVRFDIRYHGVQAEKAGPESSVTVPADARGAFAIGAIDVKSGRVESFSSQGPTVDGRKKPDFSGPDRNSSDAYALVNEDTFSGTSSATPHVAGAIALYLQAFPRTTPDNVMKYLTQNARRVDRGGDNITGVGAVFLGPIPMSASTGAATPRAVTPVGGATPVVPIVGGGTPPPTRAPMMASGGTLVARPGGTTGAGAGTVILSDDFRSSASGLPAAGYANGQYRIQAPAASILRTAYPQTLNASRITYELTGQRASGPADAGMGLVVRLADNGNYLLFAVFNDSSVVVFAKVNGSIKQLTDPMLKSPAVSASGPNTLRVVADGSNFTISVNGQPIGTLPVEGVWPSGGFGFGALGGNDDAATVVFQKFTVIAG